MIMLWPVWPGWSNMWVHAKKPPAAALWAQVGGSGCIRKLFLPQNLWCGLKSMIMWMTIHNYGLA